MINQSQVSVRFPVLMYHAVQPEPSLLSISPDIFSWQLEWLAGQGCKVITLGELAGILKKGTPLPENTIVLTFDDGAKCLSQYILPELTKHGFAATVFLVAEYCGKQNNWPSQPAGIPAIELLDWNQIREMDQHNIEFGAHTMTHPKLDTLEIRQAEKEILGSKEMIESELGHEIEVFSYPYGRYNNNVKEIVSQVFAGACSTQNGFANQRSDRYAIERIDVNYYKSPLLFQQIFSNISPPYLRVRQVARQIIGRLGNRDWY